jgi:hypothetical protein
LASSMSPSWLSRSITQSAETKQGGAALNVRSTDSDMFHDKQVFHTWFLWWSAILRRKAPFIFLATRDADGPCSTRHYANASIAYR